MSEIVNKIFLGGDKWNAFKTANRDIHIELVDLYKSKEGIQKIKETGDSWYIYQTS